MRYRYCTYSGRLFSFSLLFVFRIGVAQAQQTDTLSRKQHNHWRSEITGVTENDNYALQLRDGYYTNGLSFRFNQAHAPQAAGKRQRKLVKRVDGFEIGQMIFNPVRFDSIHVETQDRPFAGYLYGRYEQRRFYGSKAMLRWSATLGTIGQSSFAENVQRWYHKAIGIYDVQGWHTQVNNEASINLGAGLVKSLLKKDPYDRKVDLAAQVNMNLGNAFSDLSAGLIFKAGLMEDYGSSAHFCGRVSTPNTPAPRRFKEFYFYFEPSLTWQWYNATLQGGLFVGDKGPKTVDLEPWVFSTQTGFRFAKHRWTFGMHYITRSRQAVNQLLAERFVSILLAYQLARY